MTKIRDEMNRNVKDSRRFLLLILCFFVFNLFSGCQKKILKDNKRPNILFLMADDQRADAFGFMGNSNVLTPNLDNMAYDGIVFENAYCVAPICQPSRSSIMTGQFLGTHGSGFDRPTNYIITEDEFKTSYPVLLRSNEYFTGFIGKFGFAVGDGKKVKNKNFQDEKAYMPSHHFDIWNGFPGQGSYFPKDGKFNGYENNGKASHLTEFIGNQAIDFFRKATLSGKSFCLSISFKAPHAPFTPDQEFSKKYIGPFIPRMVNDKPEYYEKLPEVVKEKSRNARWYFGRVEDYYGQKISYRHDWHIEVDSIYQEYIKNYYALISGIDHTVGRIRGELKKLGIEKNTVIIYTSDNGFFAGSRQLMGKSLLYEESVKTPMIVYDPTISKKEGIRREKGLISHVDIAPTLLDIAGIDIPKNYPGNSFMPIVLGEKEKVHDAVYGENNYDDNYPVPSEVPPTEHYQSIRSKFVRTPNYKYIRYHENNPVVEYLYKMEEDPLEINNLIDDPNYVDIANELRDMLNIFEKKYVKFSN
ncbi:sulfatase-like hydrolase/transferase [Cyclobacterium sp.]|uniref:sulfatase-like hydrolase/transferase n=1 Tax=Cyclobacterium sp. TaxID=1966343 RepID=UPI0019B9D50B|nr:sulfatase-like hydrolase/transferase [Cyclobacterium sp.]MBD3630016.1 sulfatase-like hydrolase/transferase [Cyclobacterium sp.]